jgi:AraC-like DNA-binding protein
LQNISQTLVDAVCRIARDDGDFATAVPQLSLHRRSEPDEPQPCLYPRGLILVLRGHKRLAYGHHRLTYGTGDLLLISADLPVVSHLDEASAEQPFLGLLLRLDSALLIQAANETADWRPAEAMASDLVSIGRPDDGLVQAITRLVQLEFEPALLPHLAPLIQKEIAVRLLAGAHGNALRSMLIPGSPALKVARAMRWLREKFAEKTSIDALAAEVGMSPTTFRLHFRQIVGLSPVQYQKQLRLQQAKELLLNGAIDTANAAARVGYVSASQFSRDYKRFFGEPPRRDVRREISAGA